MISPFLLALSAHIFSPFLFPAIRILCFAPFLALIFQRKGFLPSLWIALLVGILVDLTNSQLPFGLFAMSYTLTALLSYHQVGRFSFLPIFTALFSLLFSLVVMALLALKGSFPPLLGTPLFTHLLLMPLVDTLYAFFWFSCPLFVYDQISRRRVIAHRRK